MPLKSGTSQKTISKNIGEVEKSFQKTGKIGTSHPTSKAKAHKQAVAVALNKAGKTIKESAEEIKKAMGQNTANKWQRSEHFAKSEAHPDDCNCKKCKPLEGKKKTEQKNLKESVVITQFIRFITEKNFAKAHKYLQVIARNKLKDKIRQYSDSKPF